MIFVTIGNICGRLKVNIPNGKGDKKSLYVSWCVAPHHHRALPPHCARYRVRSETRITQTWRAGGTSGAYFRSTQFTIVSTELNI